MNKPALKSAVSDGQNELDSYLEYNKILRTWFVAFGVGGPAFFLVNTSIGERLAGADELRFVSAMFLLGAGSQVCGALINKVSNWYVYRGAQDEAFRARRRYRFSHWLVHQFWIDIVLDLVSILAFGLALWHLLTLLAPDTKPLPPSSDELV